MERFAAYIPADRLQALIDNRELPERASGAVLFADISGFTPLTEALVLALGPRRGSEELPLRLNEVYDALIGEVERYGGSVIGFAGDAITCWFDETRPERDPAVAVADPRGVTAAARAAACGLALQATMSQFAAVTIPGAGTVALAVKVGIATGSVRRFVVGDPSIQRIDVLAGATLDRMAAAEHQAQRGDVILDAATVAALGEIARIAEWREDHDGAGRFAVLRDLTVPIPPRPWPPIADDALADEVARPWLHLPIYERLRSGQGEFLTELRPAVALFLRFGGIDFDADDLAQFKLDAFILWVQSILQRYDAALIQLTIGDKGCFLYAAFGAPIAYEDDAIRACLAALDLREPRFDYLDAVQIGISQGQMRTGAYGADVRRTYGSLGDEVNMAARLMQQAPPAQVFVSQVARQPTGDRFAWEQLAPIRVKGKSQPVTVFRLLGNEEQRRMRLHEPRYALPMVGRTAELADVVARMDEALLGAGRIVGITAEAGMGKSRLVAELVRIAQRRGIVAYGGECQSYGTTTSYLVWRTIWRGLFDLDPALPPSEQIAALTIALARLDAALLPRLPLLATALNLEIPDNELTAGFDARLRKTSLESLLVRCLEARAAQTPLVIILEDCHWLDPLSHDLIEVIGRALVDLPILLVLVYRPPDVRRLHAPRVVDLAHFHEVQLTNLPPASVRELIRLKLEQVFASEEPVADDLVEHINNHAQGNPFYVEELLNYLHDLGLDPRQPQALAQIDLPPSLHRLILSRIDQLTEHQKTLIKVASVIGRLFRAPILWGLSVFEAHQVAMRIELDTLSSMELTPLDTPDPELTYLFKHVVTQEVAYESLPFATRSVLHAQIGDTVEHRYPDEIERLLDLLAFHYDRSNNAGKRREYLLRAAEAAQRAYANAAAIDYYERVAPLLDGAEQIAAWLKLGKVLELVGDLDAAVERYSAALASAEALGDAAAAARCRSALGYARWRQSAYADAQQLIDLAYATFLHIGDRPGIAQTLGYQGAIADRQGNYTRAAEAYEASLAMWRELGDAENTAHVLNNMGIMLTNMGEHDRAWTVQQEALGCGGRSTTAGGRVLR